MNDRGPAPFTAPTTLALDAGGDHGEIVGRGPEIGAIRQQLDVARSGRLAAVSLEGEPGIGKSRLLVAAAQIATERGFTTISVTADEELRGPFLLARGILRAREAHDAAVGPIAEDLRRAASAVSGADDPGLAGLSPDEKLLRVLDLAAVAVRSLATPRARRPERGRDGSTVRRPPPAPTRRPSKPVS